MNQSSQDQRQNERDGDNTAVNHPNLLFHALFFQHFLFGWLFFIRDRALHRIQRAIQNALPLPRALRLLFRAGNLRTVLRRIALDWWNYTLHVFIRYVRAYRANFHTSKRMSIVEYVCDPAISSGIARLP